MRIYIGTLDRCRVLLGKGTTTNAIYRPVIKHTLAIESLEAHTIGMEGLKDRWLPYKLYLAMRSQGVEYSLIGKVTSACCGEASVECHTEHPTIGVTVLEYLCGTSWCHGMAT
jgi:hypothetical protein